MSGAVFLPCCFTWGQTLLKVMKIMVLTSFKGSHAGTASLSVCDPAAGRRQSTPPSDTPGNSWALLGQSIVGSVFLSSGSWGTQGFVCALQKSVSPALCKLWWLYGGFNGDLLQESFCHTQPLSHLYLHWRHSSIVLVQSLWGVWVLVHTRFLWALWAFLEIREFDPKCNFALPSILLELFLCPWAWRIFI